MATYLLTWNRARFPWHDFGEDASKLTADGYVNGRWSCGSHHVQPGDRVFLIKLGQEPRGLVASGWAMSEVFEAEHWDEDRRSLGATTTYIDCVFDVLLDPDSDPIFPRQALSQGILGKMQWSSQQSGITIPEDVAAELERFWEAFLRERGIKQAHLEPSPPEEDDAPVVKVARYLEGASRAKLVKQYERSAAARAVCIGHYGCRCFICGFDFTQTYGSAGIGFIHVHHLDPIAAIGEEHELDPIKDLRPVCPNCHAIIHRRQPPYTVEEVQSLLVNSQDEGD